MLVVTVTTCPDASSDETDFAQCRGAALNAWDQGAIGFKQFRRVVKKLFLVFSLLIPRWLHGSNDSLSSLAEAASEPRLRSTDAAPWLPWHGTEVCDRSSSVRGCRFRSWGTGIVRRNSSAVP